jgi:hypothetical protein
MANGRRGGIPGPESRTGLVRPAMTEAEFERRQSGAGDPGPAYVRNGSGDDLGVAMEHEPVPMRPQMMPQPSAPQPSGRSRAPRVKATKPKRVQRMFALEEELDKKLWLYAIHVGKDRSEVINDLLRPVVASMVLYDSRDRRSSSGRAAEPMPEPMADGGGESVAS